MIEKQNLMDGIGSGKIAKRIFVFFLFSFFFV